MNSGHEPLGIHQWARQPRESTSADHGRAWKTSKLSLEVSVMDDFV